MSIVPAYAVISILLFLLELGYFQAARRFNIVDRPNERSSHSVSAISGGGVIFLFGMWIWAAFFGFQYVWFLLALTLVAGVSFVDDIHSLPVSLRLAAQFAAAALMTVQLYLQARSEGMFSDSNLLVSSVLTIISLTVIVGASNIVNFLDGINGMTGAYAFASLLPLFILNRKLSFVDESLMIVTAIADLIFCFFNFRPKGKAKCFAGDAGAFGMAFILLFLIYSLIVRTEDASWIIFLVVYGVDGCLTIIHRIILRENLGEAHRKHAYELMANELGIGHLKIASFYALLQLAISLGFIYLCPQTPAAHWLYLICTVAALSLAYIVFMKKYYHLHEEYLAGLEEKNL